MRLRVYVGCNIGKRPATEAEWQAFLDKVNALCDLRKIGYTLTRGTGYWEAISEESRQFEFIGLTVETGLELADLLAELATKEFGQDCILYTLEPVYHRFRN